MYGLSLVTAPAAEPVSLAEAKKQVEVATAYTAHDSHLTRLITAARLYAEKWTHRQIVTATWDYVMDRFPCGIDPIILPLAPLQSVTTLKYYNTDDTQQTWSSANYLVSTARTPGQIQLALNVNWPAISGRRDAITVRFVAGYGLAAACPEDLKAAMLLLIGHWFENRTEVITGTITAKIPIAAERLLDMNIVGDEFTTYAAT